MSRYAVLIGQIERELESLQQLVDQTDSLMQRNLNSFLSLSTVFELPESKMLMTWPYRI